MILRVRIFYVKENDCCIPAPIAISLSPGDFDRIEFNNGVLLAYRRYIHGLEKFETLYEYLGWNLRRVIEFLKEIKESNEKPSSFLDRWMKGRGINLPNS
jgi:hypothetical protein